MFLGEPLCKCGAHSIMIHIAVPQRIMPQNSHTTENPHLSDLHTDS